MADYGLSDAAMKYLADPPPTGQTGLGDNWKNPYPGIQTNSNPAQYGQAAYPGTNPQAYQQYAKGANNLAPPQPTGQFIDIEQQRTTANQPLPNANGVTAATYNPHTMGQAMNMPAGAWGAPNAVQGIPPRGTTGGNVALGYGDQSDIENVRAGAGYGYNTPNYNPPTGGGGSSQRAQVAASAGATRDLSQQAREWMTIKPMADASGINLERLVGVYMKEGNPAAATNLRDALAQAQQDDAWGNVATQAFGRPPNQREWDEHWYAMHGGGRDPLEGHPQAVQMLQQEAERIKQQNQQAANSLYNDLLHSGLV